MRAPPDREDESASRGYEFPTPSNRRTEKRHRQTRPAAFCTRVPNHNAAAPKTCPAPPHTCAKCPYNLSASPYTIAKPTGASHHLSENFLSPQKQVSGPWSWPTPCRTLVRKPRTPVRKPSNPVHWRIANFLTPANIIAG